MTTTPKVFLLREGSKLPCRVPFDGAPHAELDVDCPHCGVPLKAHGCGKRPSDDDRAYEADARCCTCGQPVGVLRVEVNTLFGVREDERVMNMGVRIF